MSWSCLYIKYKPHQEIKDEGAFGGRKAKSAQNHFLTQNFLLQRYNE